MSESSDWKCIVLDKQSYKQAMIEYAGMTPEEANKEVEEHFSKWHNLNAKDNDYQSVMFSRFKHRATAFKIRQGE